MHPRAVAALLGALVLAAPAVAQASDAEVTGDVTGQFYDVRSPTGETVLLRRRLTTTLGVSAYDLMDRPAGDVMAPELTFRARVRYDADYGIDGGTVTPSNYGSFVPGVQQGLVDLMYAYVEGRRFAKGWLGFKVGRQYVVDALGWWSFDGGEVSATTPYFVKAEAYGGFEQRGGMPLSTARYEAEGVWRGDRQGYDPTLAPAFQPAALAPAFGVALESTGVTWIHGRLTYRRVYDTGSSNLTEFASGTYAPAQYDGGRISSEKVGYSMDANLPTLGGVKAGVVYDLYNAEMTNLYASIDAYAGKKVTVSADYDYYVPTYDADSIWNFFAGEPMNDVGLRANVDATDWLSFAGGGHVRVFNTPGDSVVSSGGGSPYPNFLGAVLPTNGHPFDEGANLSARWRTGETLVTLRGSGNWGDDGDRVGADVRAQHVFETRYVASVRTGVWQWNDKLEPDRSATTFNYVLGAGYRFAPRSRAMVEWEHDINGLVGQRFRLMLNLVVAVANENLKLLAALLPLFALLAAVPLALAEAPVTLHGLAPLPDDQKVPHRMLPPGSFDPDEGPSDVIFPAQHITLRFNHQKHLAKGMQLTCKTCHGKAYGSASSQDVLLPKGSTCDACHSTDHDDLNAVKPGDDAMGKCEFCHLGYKPGDGNKVAELAMPRANLVFDHKKHVDRNIGCAQCHGPVEELELATRDQLPRMRGCFTCHEMADSASRGTAKSSCDTCHLRGDSSGGPTRIKTMFATGTLSPPRWLHNAAHTPDFIDRHKLVAADDSAFCANCHTEDYCTDCHDGRVRPRDIHPSDYLNMHPVEARMEPQKCQSCHQQQSFCLGCHQRAGVAESSPPNAKDSARFHPPKSIWSDPPMKPGSHGFEAERNLNACVSCHTERDCVACHGALGVGGGFDPHRKGFLGGCSNQMRRNPRPCFVCHEPSDPVLGQCR